MGTTSPSHKTNTLAIVSFVLSFFVAIGGVIAGHFALRQIAKTGESGRGLAIAALVIGYFQTVAVVAVVVWALILFGTGATQGLSSPAAAAPETNGIAAAPTPTPTPLPFDVHDHQTNTVGLVINGHTMTVSLNTDRAPVATASILHLAKIGFYNNVRCHRLTTSGIYVLQCGDPTGLGNGGPGYSFGPIENAPADQMYRKGWLAMARTGSNPSSMGSQFFILYKDSNIPNDAAGGYTVVGQISSGLDAVDEVAAGGVAGGTTDGPPSVRAVINRIDLM